MLNSVNERYFDWLPKNKTIFQLEKSVKTSFNLGDLTPLGFFEALPGDTFNFSANAMLRVVSPFIKSPMERMKLNYVVFKVPLRILYDNFKKVMGERDDYETNPDTTYEYPEIKFVDSSGQPVNNYAKSILAYLGVPIPSSDDIIAGRKLKGINKLLSNAYALCWNEHIRDQNLQKAKLIDKSDADIRMIAEADADSDFHKSAPDKYTGKLAKVNRQFDYFSNAFTDTQKGQTAVLSLAGDAPVRVITDKVADARSSREKFQWTNADTGALEIQGLTTPGNNDEPGFFVNGGGLGDPNTSETAFWNGISKQRVIPRNLWTDLSNVSALNINQLREVEHLQKRKELDLVAGTRYYEIVDNYFDIKNALATLDYPEIISYSQSMININQVVQTSGTGIAGSTPQGNISGYSVESKNSGIVNVMCQEHSFIMPMVYITQDHTYQHGLHRAFTRKNKLDHFDPLQIGNGFQGIKKSEIYGHLKDDEQNDIWAFAPNHERMRKETDIITGQLNVNAVNSISQWHMGDVYTEPPTFSGDWKLEKHDLLDNVLAVKSDVVDQFILRMDFKGIKISVVDPLGVPRI